MRIRRSVSRVFFFFCPPVPFDSPACFAGVLLPGCCYVLRGRVVCVSRWGGFQVVFGMAFRGDAARVWPRVSWDLHLRLHFVCYGLCLLFWLGR